MAMRVMVQGTMSGAGKSLLAAALCRIFRQDGLRAVPFKSQNMALNSHVTRDGLEMGRAQAMQAQAAGVEPDVRMNPVLLKPTSDAGSQLVVMGRARGDYRAAEYYRMKATLVPEVMAAFRSLAAEADVVVIEGAGSPAEINLKDGDFVNMGLARMVDAPVLLVGDIDRGGVFAQLFGTVALLEPDERARVAGLVVNKFRGDKSILDPGLEMLEERCGVPVLGVVPYLSVDLDDEDSLAPRLQGRGRAGGPGGPGLLDVAVVRLPRISNFTDFAPLERHPALSVRYAASAAELGEPDLVVLPGTKSTMRDLAWMRAGGLADAVRSLALSGRSAVLGVCGGYQMLGERLSDPSGSEGGGEAAGLGLLPCETVFGPEKALRRARGRVAAPGLAGARVEGYEVHCGRTDARGAAPFSLLRDEAPGGGAGAAGERPDGAVSADGSAMGTYLHGLFDTGELVGALASWLAARRAARGAAGGAAPLPSEGLAGPQAACAPAEPRGAGQPAEPQVTGQPAELRDSDQPAGSQAVGQPVEPQADFRERQFDLLADAVRSSLDMGAVYRAMEERGAGL